MFRQEEKGEDRAIDRLLKAQAALSGKPGRLGKSGRLGKPVRSTGNRSSGGGFGETGCTGFDPDLANAYVERLLGSLEVHRYEEHLSQCAACRSTIARMALADNKTIYGPPRVSTVDGRPGWIGRLTRTGPSAGSGLSRKLISIFFRPQWIVAMAAVVVLLISIPVLFTRHTASSHPDLVASTATSSGFADSNGNKSPVTGAPSEA
ncbi:MAG: zf-HC2 domain-containing protein, partial [Blastocatellia bacterium]